jgi:hypothetical protein
MDKYSDLAPWILGGISAAAIAVAITVGSNNRTAPRTLPAPSPAIAEILPTASAIPQSPPPQLAAEQLPPTAPPPAQPQAIAMQPLTQPQAAAGQIWECTTNGQKTFSNNPCGEKSSLREIGPINTMDPTPVFSQPRSYQPDPRYVQDDGYQGTQDADDSYPSPVGIPYFVHRRSERAQRPNTHTHGPASHGPAPRRY